MTGTLHHTENVTEPYILMKQKEKIAVQDQTISAKEVELQAITVRIEDTEAFVEEVSEVAYEKAVEVVTDKVVEETHNADFDMVMHHGKKVVSDPALAVIISMAVKFAAAVRAVDKTCQGMGRAPSVRPSGHIRPEFLDQIEGLLIDDRLLRILKHDPEIFINIVAVGILEMLARTSGGTDCSIVPIWISDSSGQVFLSFRRSSGVRSLPECPVCLFRSCCPSR